MRCEVIATVVMCVVCLGMAGGFVGGQEPAALYRCDFEGGPGILRLRAQGEGCEAVIDETEADALAALDDAGLAPGEGGLHLAREWRGPVLIAHKELDVFKVLPNELVRHGDPYNVREGNSTAVRAGARGGS